MFTTLFWKKAWTWLKHYWYFPVIILLLIFGTVAGRSSRRKLFGLLEKQKENYEKEIQVVKEAAKEVSESKTKVAEEFVEEIKLIEEEHEVKIEDLEKEAIVRTLKFFSNNRRASAKSLGMSERTLYRKINQYGLERKIKS